MNFKKWLETTWFPLRPDEKINSEDNPPQLTPNGDYILYHGTNIVNARKIFKERRLLKDDIGTVGVTTHPSRAQNIWFHESQKVCPISCTKICNR